MYHCYLIELKQNFDSDVPVHDIVLVMRSELDSDLGSMHFDLDVDRGSLTVNFKYVGVTLLSPEQVTSLFFFFPYFAHLTGVLNKFIKKFISVFKTLFEGPFV
jgi:hypothetical protein